ncbi:retrovirus-related Pol poly from transposon [Octopus vulgaris]|uniref:Retrovirus-related Pol poly from transposon n=2 Tax=Octopus TaxID=6643 RepID=A0AA36BHR8_OCTVU|nr:uncharacterized protein LOC115222664 [Octopus sinensis]CAI9734294.1 retrovirus-related Pol poly from transposon [Octopus vulgaris]
MFNCQKRSKPKNEKIMRWRIELAQYQFDIIYRQGKFNVASDALSRTYCAATTDKELYRIHAALCHPRITRLFHYIKVKNLPYSVDDVKRITNNCVICCEVKPRFTKTSVSSGIKSTQAFERLNLDFKGPLPSVSFKGPLPSVSKNHYFLTVVDEYSRFSFIFPCTNTSGHSVISNLKVLFSLFGFPAVIHSGNAKCFASKELNNFCMIGE